MHARKLQRFQFVSSTSENWSGFPPPEKLREQIARAVLAHSELAEEALGFYAPPQEIRETKISAAAFNQIMCMWHGHRLKGHQAPPPIPLKLFVFAFGQDESGTWANIEVLPGMDDWSLD